MNPPHARSVPRGGGWLPVGAAALPFAMATTHDRTAELRHVVKPDNRGRSLKRAAAAPPRVVRRTNAFLGRPRSGSSRDGLAALSGLTRRRWERRDRGTTGLIASPFGMFPGS